MIADVRDGLLYEFHISGLLVIIYILRFRHLCLIALGHACKLSLYYIFILVVSFWTVKAVGRGDWLWMEYTIRYVCIVIKKLIYFLVVQLGDCLTMRMNYVYAYRPVSNVMKSNTYIWC